MYDLAAAYVYPDVTAVVYDISGLCFGVTYFTSVS